MADQQQQPKKKDNSNNSSPQKKNYRRRYYRKPKPQQNNQQEENNYSNKIKTIFRKVTILVPLFNEEESLHPLYKSIKETLNKISCDHEILFVDDGSNDRSLNILRELAGKDNRVKFLSFRKNYGKSAALHVGFNAATGNAVITMDADLQDDPEEIPNLLAKLEEGYDLVSGWKKKRFDPFIKRHSSKFFNYVTRVLTGIKIHDFNCGLKAYRKDVVKNVDVYGELHRYIPVLASHQGFRVTEIPVKHHPRRYGKTKFGISRFFKGFVDLITVLFNTRYITRPMHLFGFLGAASFFVGFLVNAYLTYEKLFLDKAIGNRPMLFLGMLLIIVGAQFFSVGLLGEIMVHNFRSDREYSIKEKK